MDRIIRNFSEIELHLGGRMGIAALDTGNGKQVSYRGGERFAMCSTFKWFLVACVLNRVDKGQLSLDQLISYSTADLIEHSPFTQSRLTEGNMAVSDLCGAAIEISDNTATNLLLNLIGGPQGLTGYSRELGDFVTRLDRTDPDLNYNSPGDDRDTTTPDAMIGTMNKILVENALPSPERTKLINWMKSCRTGLERLRAGLPRDWIAGDKTGTGRNGAANDNAILWPPDRAPILIAAYLSESAAPLTALNAAHAQIGRIISAAFI